MVNILNILNKLSAANIYIYVENGKLKTKADESALTPEIIYLIRSNRNELLKYLSATLAAERIHHQQILPRKGREGLLSFAQQGLWLLDQIRGDSAHYNISGSLRLIGELSTKALNQAFSTIIERHESLRTCFVKGNDSQPAQLIQTTVPFLVPLVDLSELGEDERQLQLSELVATESSRVFDLSSDLMLRAQLIGMAINEHVLLVTMHHIASDGWSMSVLINEFSLLYSAYVQGEENPLTPLEVQYADYAHWQRNWLQGEVLDNQLDYWTTQLGDLPTVHSLPLDHPRPSVQNFVGNIFISRIGSEVSDALGDVCLSNGATLFMGLHAAFSVLLSRYSNETDIVMGTSIANREQAEVAGLIGFFVNMLVLRSDLSENPSFITLLNQSKAMLLDAYAHQQVPFEQIVEHLQPERSSSHSPLFQVMLVLHNNEEGTLELPGLTISSVDRAGVGVANYDLTLHVTESAEGLQLGWEYNTDLFEARTIARMATHFELLLTSLLRMPNENVFKAEMLSVQERHQLLVEWNDIEADYPKDKCIHELFEMQVAKSPESVALVFEDEELTYQELNSKANQLAHYLIEQGVGPDILVGICVERSLEMVIGLLGILKAGGAYVPLDPGYPVDRLSYMLEDSGVSILVTQLSLFVDLPITDQQVVCVDGEAFFTDQPIDNLDVKELKLNSGHLAYVIYTSGTTGLPKGTLIEHHSVISLLVSNTYVPLSTSTKMLQGASLSFDAATFEIWAPLLNGGQIAIWANTYVSTIQLGDFINEQAVNTAWMTSGLFDKFVSTYAEQLPSLKYLLVGGDVVNGRSVELMKERNEGIQIINGYGPTENTTFTCCYAIPEESDDVKSIPIGRPIGNRRVYIVDKSGNPSAIGLVGELYVGGAGVARGYLNHPKLTEEKFILDPFCDDLVARLYKTGDLGCWNEDGTISYLGRNDHQVKIRGFRIELGEIENHLRRQEDVNDALVMAFGDGGDRQLVAYITSSTNPTVSIRSSLRASLPEYMIPSQFMMLESFPLTPNGKIDRKALPKPDGSGLIRREYEPPQSEIERLLCEVWEELLKVEQVGVTDNFFELGGSSLMAIDVTVRFNEKAKLRMELADLFKHQTPRELSDFLVQLKAGSLLEELLPISQESYPLSFEQEGVWVQYVFGKGANYNMPAIIQVKDSLNLPALQSAVTMLEKKHDLLRTRYIQFGGEARQLIHTEPAILVECIHFQNDDEWKDRVLDDIQRKTQIAMDIESGKSFEIYCYPSESNEVVVFINVSHIAVDGKSYEGLIQELLDTYESFIECKDVKFEKNHLQYKDYAVYQRRQFKDIFHEQELFWEKELSKIININGLKLDKNKSLNGDYSPSSFEFSIDKDEHVKLTDFAKKNGCTKFALMMSMYSLLMSIHNEEEIVCIGTDYGGRNVAGTENMFGLFVNQLPVVTVTSCDDYLLDGLLSGINATTNSLANSQVPFSLLVKKSSGNQSGHTTPIFQSKLSYQDFSRQTSAESGLHSNDKYRIVDVDAAQAKWPLMLTVSSRSDSTFGLWSFDESVLENETINRLTIWFKEIVRLVLDESNVRIVDLKQNLKALEIKRARTVSKKFNVKRRFRDANEI